MDLSNYLLLKTRERLLLENKVNNPKSVLKSAKPSATTALTSASALQECRKELILGLRGLLRLFYITKGTEDLPVAFASNALYVLERNGGGSKEDYERLLLPILRSKMEFLHAEGVS